MPPVDDPATSAPTRGRAQRKRKRATRLQGTARDRMGKLARELYVDEELSVRAVAERLGGWSYGATYRLLRDYDVMMRGRGAQGRAQPRAASGGDGGSSAA